MEAPEFQALEKISTLSPECKLAKLNPQNHQRMADFMNRVDRKEQNAKGVSSPKSNTPTKPLSFQERIAQHNHKFTKEGSRQAQRDILGLRQPKAPAVVQAKLEVNDPGDDFEKEADQVAEKVVTSAIGGGEEGGADPSSNEAPPAIQKKCLDCEKKEEEIQRMPISDASCGEGMVQRKCADCEEEDQKIQRKPAVDGGTMETPSGFDSKLASTRGAGNPLDLQTKEEMESKIGADVSNVRLHTDGNASNLSKDITAKAFTYGSDIFFNQGQLDTRSTDGRRLLAHELAHVVQQGGGSDGVIRRKVDGGGDELPEPEVFETSEGKAIKVVSPPDLDGPTALVQVVMAMMRITESEAKIMIVKEGIHWVNYQQDGNAKDNEGNVIRYMNFKPRYSERTAHEPESLKPKNANELQPYLEFKHYLEEHEGDNIRDPYIQFEEWAKGTFYYFPEPTLGQSMFANTDALRTHYLELRDAVVEYVIWERLRAKRESIVKGLGVENGDMISRVEALADSFPIILDADTLRHYLPNSYYWDWTLLHADMISAQVALQEGDASKFRQDDLANNFLSLSDWFYRHAKEKAEAAESADWNARKSKDFDLANYFRTEQKFYEKYGEEDLQEVRRLAIMEDFGFNQALQLLYQYYKLTFALMEVAGHIIAAPARREMVEHPEEDEKLDLTGFQIENRGKTGTAILSLQHDHPSAKKVNAIFYPEKETKDFRQKGEKNFGDDWSKGMILDLYLWHDVEEGEWVLEDFTNIEEHKVNRAKWVKDAPVPAALFTQLNEKIRFPTGALFYQVPGEASYRILRTTSPMTLGDWLRFVAIGGLAIGLALATAGASIPAQVIMIGSAVAMAGAEVADMVEESKHDMLTTERVMVHGALIASCFLRQQMQAYNCPANYCRL